MIDEQVKILIVEDNPGDARLIREMLGESRGVSFEVDWVQQLSEAVERLRLGSVDLVLLDLGLPDSQGLDTFLKAAAAAPQVPFVVLSGLNDEAVALAAMREGAQDYLIKSRVDGALLFQAIRYAVERKKVQEELRDANARLLVELEERRRAEAAVAAERQRLYNLVEGLPAVVNLKGPDFLIRYANRRFREFFGEWRGKHCFEVFASRSEPCEGCPAAQVFQTGVPCDEYEFADTQRRRFFQMYHYLLPGERGARLVLSMGVDITGRKQAVDRLRESEARFRAVFESAAIGIGLYDLNGCFMRANKVLQGMLGYGEEELKGKHFQELVHPDDLARNVELFQELVSGRRDHYQMEKRQRRKNGQYLWCRVTTSAVKDRAGQPLYVAGMAEDISLQKLADMRLKASEQKLRYLATQLMSAQEHERRRISLELHDELGQALLVLKLQARHLEEALAPELQGLRDECREVLVNLDQVVDKVRRLSRDLSPIILEDLGLSAALRKLIRDFSKHNHLQYQAPEIHLDGLFPPEAELAIFRIFQECLTNIGRHSQATLLTVAIEKLADRVSFLIRDNGRGFAALKLHPRTGLGVVAIEERARMVGGSLSIQSRKGQGTSISFDIPLALGEVLKLAPTPLE